jgi:hypothetical protein
MHGRHQDRPNPFSFWLLVNSEARKYISYTVSTTIETSVTAGEPTEKASDEESKEVIGLPFVPSKLIESTEVRSAVSVF